MTIYVLAPRDRMYVITPSWYLMIFGFASFAFNNNNELYLDDHTSTYSVAKAILGIKMTTQGNYVTLIIMCHEHQNKLKFIL